MRVAVIGATGVLGLHLVPRLVERGHEVYACAPSSEQLHRLFAPLNIKLIVNNILERDSLISAVTGCDVVMHIATAVPRPDALSPDWSLNDRIRREGTANLVAVSEKAGVGLYIQQSIAHLANASGDIWLDEDSEIKPTVVTQSAFDMEGIVKGSHLPWQIIRGGSLYGPGTGREESWAQLAHEGKLTMPGNGLGYISLVHVSDLAAALVNAVEANTRRQIINVVDDNPITYSELYTYITKILAAPSPMQGAVQGLPPYRASNKRAKALLSWKPHYSTYCSGLATLGR